MKKLTLILLTILALTLTACRGASDSTEPVTTTRADPSAQTLSGPTLLILGTLKLDGTGQAVTPDQAAELLPLWQVYQSLTDSDTAAQAEVDALLQQIEDSLTDEQMQTIKDMGLTQQDSFAIMQEMGLGMGGQRQSGNSDSGDDNFAPPGGGMQPGMGGGGGPGGVPGQGPGGQSLSPEQIATAQAARAAGGGPNRVPPALVEAMIQYLQKIAGS